MTEDQIKAIRLGKPFRSASAVGERISWYEVEGLTSRLISAKISRHVFGSGNSWIFTVEGFPQFQPQQESFQTEEEALEGFRNWLRKNKREIEPLED